MCNWSVRLTYNLSKTSVPHLILSGVKILDRPTSSQSLACTVSYKIRLTLFRSSHLEIVRCCYFEEVCHRLWQLMAVGRWRRWLQKERGGERAFNLDPNRPLHLSTTRGVNQHLNKESGDKGEEKKEKGMSSGWDGGKWENRDREGVDYRDG